MSSFSTKTNSTFNTFLNILVTFTFFLLIGLLISFLIAEPNKSEATTTSASAGSSVYYASISNDNTVTIPITPTNTQTEYTNTNNIKFTSTCTKGAYVYINTNSASNNSLTRTGSDSGVKTIDAVAGDVTTGLTDNTWGFKTSGKVFSQVPVNTSPAVLYYSTVAETNTDIDVIYGVKLDNTIPSGTYTNDVVYTVAVAPECLAYTLKFNTDGGSTISDQSINYGDTVNLNNYTTTKSGYIFGGWSNGSLDFTGTETTANPNPDNNFTVTLSACWVKSSAYAYDYTGGEQTFTAPCGGYYKLEVWGASGADGWNSWTTKIYQKTLGKGAYVAGSIKVNKNNPLYIYVGGAATKLTGYSDAPGGYNGGGGGCKAVDGDDAAGAGGGSTDIRVISGEWNDDNSLRSRILVAGGGGGSHLTLDTATLYEQGRHAGGISVVGQISGKTDSDIWSPTVNQTTGGAFGYGATGICPSGAGHSGGGGGWYGGEAKSTGNENDGAGGSSYISGHTGAVGVTSTSDSSPKTGCTTGTTNNTCSLTPYINPATGTYYTFTNTVMIDGAGYAWTNTKGSLQQMPNPSGGYYASGVGHSGNGYAKITYLGTTI